MKMKILTIIALCGSSLSPVLVTPAWAITPLGATTTAMAAECTADLGANAAVTLHDSSQAFSTVVIETGQVDGSPTEVSNTRVETPGSRFGTGTPTYSNVQIVGNPFRNGGSVNMFGDQVATNKNWPNSEYDFTANFSTVTTISYNCQVSEVTETYHPAVHIPGHKVLGFYYVDPAAPGNSAGHQNACDSFNSTGDSLPFWGDPQAQCLFQKTGDAVDPVDEDEYWTNNAPIARPDLNTSNTIDETNVASGTGHETNGGPFTEIGNWLAGKVVVCISPSKTVKGGTPGAWANHNGYIGNKCTTAWFNIAPWGGGSQTSNGTYISVPST